MKPDQEFVALANCHAKGLFSIPLEVSEGWVRRLFVDTLGLTHTVAPHSHRYSLRLDVLTGQMGHTIWEEDSWGPMEMYHFGWQSPLNGPKNMKGEPVLEGYFELLDPTPTRYTPNLDVISPGHTTVRMEEYEIHSLKTKPGTSWVITEFLDSQEETVTLHHSPTYAPDLSGLYIPMPS